MANKTATRIAQTEVAPNGRASASFKMLGDAGADNAADVGSWINVERTSWKGFQIYPFNRDPIADGVTNGTNTLTSASNPFLATMVGAEIDFDLYGKRTIVSFVGVGEITFDGAVIPVDTGVEFTLPGTIGATIEIDGAMELDDETNAFSDAVPALIGTLDNTTRYVSSEAPYRFVRARATGFADDPVHVGLLATT